MFLNCLNLKEFFILHIFRRTEVQYLPSDQTKLEFADNGDTVDYVKIEPFDAHGLKKGAEVRCVR